MYGRLKRAQYVQEASTLLSMAPVAKPLRTLDEILTSVAPPLGAIALAKIDTAGSECEVLAGGGGVLLRRLRADGLLLVNVETPRSEACVRELAATSGFGVHAFAHARIAPRGKHVVLARRR